MVADCYKCPGGIRYRNLALKKLRQHRLSSKVVLHLATTLNFDSLPLKLEDAVKKKILRASQTWRGLKNELQTSKIFYAGIGGGKFQVSGISFEEGLKSISIKKMHKQHLHTKNTWEVEK